MSAQAGPPIEVSMIGKANRCIGGGLGAVLD